MATQQLNALKTINNLQRDGSLQDLLLSVKEVKSKIETLSKAIADRKSALQAKSARLSSVPWKKTAL